jgi:heme exporter protein D
MIEFLAMGGYAFYVWGAYGVTALVIVIELLAARARRRAAMEEARLAAPEDPAPSIVPGGAQ